MDTTSRPDVPLYSILGADQTAKELLEFYDKYAPCLPIVIDSDHVIRHCSPRLREALGYGWQADLVNGQTRIEVLIPVEHREPHIDMINHWFEQPAPVAMHTRGALPILCADGKILRALINLAPYEGRDWPTHVLTDAASYRNFAFVFITLLPQEWELHGVVVIPPYPVPVRL